jgi:tRNA pseudouridine13 synthase
LVTVSPVDAGNAAGESLPGYAGIHQPAGLTLHSLLEIFAHVSIKSFITTGRRFIFNGSTAHGRGLPVPLMHSSLRELPYATAKSLRTLGKIREQPEDFRVDEVPAYLPGGQGEHLFVHFEKRSLTTRDAVERLAKALGSNPRDAGFAGLKDKQAVTTQWASFPGASAEQARGLELPGIRVLDAARHGNKLRTGHLRGNRFQIRVRGQQLDADVARTILTELTGVGAPNYYGEQRFGIAERNLERARAWVMGGGRAPRDRFERKLLFSTLQSALFNAWLAERIHAGLYQAVVPGDLMRKEDSGGLFVATAPADVADATQRMRAWEISPTGPMFGAKMRWPEADAAQREQAVLEAAGITLETFAAHAKYGEGTRRPMRIRPEAWQVEVEAEALLVSFDLPSGGYATMVLRELLKQDLETPRHDGDLATIPA